MQGFAFEEYMLAQAHPLRARLDKIFASSEVLQEEGSLKRAGFVILHDRPSTLLVARHRALPGYLVKVYPYSSPRSREENFGNLVNRCKGAENIRNLIQEKGLKRFVVPDKWLYFTPDGEGCILVVTDMDLLSSKQSKRIWKKRVTQAELEELYCIISHGYASSKLPANIPYTKKGVFACIDTEQPIRVPRYENVKAHLSPAMALYWEKLVLAQ